MKRTAMLLLWAMACTLLGACGGGDWSTECALGYDPACEQGPQRDTQPVDCAANPALCT